MKFTNILTVFISLLFITSCCGDNHSLEPLCDYNGYKVVDAWAINTPCSDSGIEYTLILEDTKGNTISVNVHRHNFIKYSTLGLIIKGECPDKKTTKNEKP